MSADEPSFQPPRLFVASLVALALVCAATFMLSAYGLYGYGRSALHLAQLAVVVPAGVDLLSLCGIYALYATRDDSWKVRAYAWTVFAIPTVVSVSGNVAFAKIRGDVLAGVIGAGCPPILLALAVHLVIVVRKSLEDQFRRERASVTLANAIRRAGGVPVVSFATTGGAVSYRLLNAEGVCIRAGHTLDIAGRITQYRSREAWWPDVASIDYETHASLERARAAERMIIRTENPIHNRHHRTDGGSRTLANITPRERVPQPDLRGRVSRASRKSGRAPNPNRDVAVKRALAGESPGALAIEYGVSRRAVEGWVKAARDSATGVAASPAQDPPASRESGLRPGGSQPDLAPDT